MLLIDVGEELQIIVERIIQESLNGVPIIVEGKRDLEALRNIGVKGEIIIFKSLRELVDKLRILNAKRVILLMDMDREGEDKTRYIKKFLEGIIEVDTAYWLKLYRYRYLGFTTIESFFKNIDKMVRKEWL
ncbi:MAG: toprim domain-containing protein [Nitrososphaerota archaeon]|nr:toprim domain-containing protein [Candidatus Geocrenenecus dongiae]